MQASLGLFRNKATIDNQTLQELPLEIYEAVKRVIQYQTCEYVKLSSGSWIIRFNEFGPFNEQIGEWMPVHIIRLVEWTSGGITEKEYADYQLNLE